MAYRENIDIFSLTDTQYADHIQKALGKGYHHALKLYRDWFQKGGVSSTATWVEPQAQALVQTMISITDFSLPKIIPPSKGEGAYKFLVSLDDGLETESVVIPMGFGKTLCISSQVGCNMGCAFCVTAKMGLIRNLRVSEITRQLFAARHILGEKVRNIVFMGMGEPLDSFDAAMQAVRVLCCERGFSIAPAKVTISTSGLVDKIYRLIDELPPKVNLAVSVNAPDDDSRSRLMPVNKHYNMASLKEAMLAFSQKRGKKILIEYILIEDLTDKKEDAEKLITYLEGLEVSINVIPYNPGSRGPFKRPESERIEAFIHHLRSRGLSVLLRTTKGEETMAACGQLGNKRLRSRLKLVSQGTID